MRKKRKEKGLRREKEGKEKIRKGTNVKEQRLEGERKGGRKYVEGN